MMRTAIFGFTIVLLLATGSWAQPPAETCGAGDSLSGSDMLPQTLSMTPTSNDFNLNGSGCVELGDDHVTCMTPASSCDVAASCADSVAPLAPRGLQIGISLVQGSCTTTPASCLASNSGTGGGSINFSLVGGTTYCFVCETGNSPVDVTLSLTTTGDCGALPVGLQSFEVE